MTDTPEHGDDRGCTCCELSGTVPGEPTWTTAPPATAETLTSRSLPPADGSAASSIAAREHRRAGVGADHGPPRYLRFAVLLI
jgi:hypothetical protein